MMRIALLIAALTLAQPALAAPKPAPKDHKVWQAAVAARTGQLALLETLVNIDSGTGDVAGGRKAADVLVPRLEALGMTIERRAAEAPGLPENLVARLRGRGKGRILMIGHIDTVFEPGTAARWPFRIEGDRATGPGVGDEKGGVVQGLYAVKILRDLRFTGFKEIAFLIETSEERGSPGTRALIRELLQNADVELNLEPGDPPDRVTVWRKGSVTFHIDVKGRAAHAGVAPQDGRNAAVELIHQLQVADSLPKTGDGLTANLTLLSAGVRHNIIPDSASAGLNVRGRTAADLTDVEALLRRNAQTTIVPDTQVSVRAETAFPPLPSNAATDTLADRAEAIYAGLGLSLGRGGNGGASESALAAEQGVPALDGLGPVGGGFHSEREYLDLTTMTPRLYLLTRMLMELGQAPPHNR